MSTTKELLRKTKIIWNNYSPLSAVQITTDETGTMPLPEHEGYFS